MLGFLWFRAFSLASNRIPRKRIVPKYRTVIKGDSEAIFSFINSVDQALTLIKHRTLPPSVTISVQLWASRVACFQYCWMLKDWTPQAEAEGCGAAGAE